MVRPERLLRPAAFALRVRVADATRFKPASPACRTGYDFVGSSNLGVIASIKKGPMKGPFLIDGAPGEIRTPDRSVRSRVLYPAELRARAWNARPRIMRSRPSLCQEQLMEYGGERGIRTLDGGLSPHTPLAGERLRPARPSLHVCGRKHTWEAGWRKERISLRQRPEVLYYR